MRRDDSPTHRSGPVKSQVASDAIAAAVLEELAERGYASLTIDAVALRAGVGKMSIYRRWPGKLEMVLDVLVAADPESESDDEVPEDRGDLESDLRAVVETLKAQLTNPLARRIVPDLLAEAVRDSSLGAVVVQRLRRFRARQLATVLDRAITRKELPADLDRELAVDLIAAPLLWRMVAGGGAVSDSEVETLLTMILAGLRSAAHD